METEEFWKFFCLYFYRKPAMAGSVYKKYPHAKNHSG